MTQVLEADILLKRVIPDVIDDKLSKAFIESKDVLSKIDILGTNLKRKDHQGKLKEILREKTFTSAFVLRQKLNKNMIILEYIGDSSRQFKCIIPVDLEAAMLHKDFLFAGECYLMTQLTVCVARYPEVTVFFCVTASTKSNRLLL